MSTLQAAPSPVQDIMSNINAVNAKIDSLAETINDIAIDDGLKSNSELKQHIDKRLAEITPKIQEKKKRDFKIKDLDTYDGETQNLRSWLTAAGLQMENKGIEGDEAKINFVAGYLRGKAWNWFEPILREKRTEKRADWSDRTTRILGSYKEMEKAMAQVFGDVDERKTAARQMQKLRQTRSVTDYITEFQMIASNLDWDEEALEDKFTEGLKPNVQSALIYFPTDADNLEEIMARAQKIDRQQWENRKERNNFQHLNYRRKDSPRRKLDYDGDVVMTGAKISSEEAKEKGLCFNCGKKGHLARNCRQRKYQQKRPQKKDNGRDVTIRMVRTISGIDAIDQDTEQEEPTESRVESELMEVSSLFQGLTSRDFADTESSDDDASIQQAQGKRRYIEDGQDESTKEVPRVPERQSDGKYSFGRIHEEISAPEINQEDNLKDSIARRSTTAQQLPQAVLLPPSPSFSFLALAGEIRPQPSLIPACQSVCPCLA